MLIASVTVQLDKIIIFFFFPEHSQHGWMDGCGQSLLIQLENRARAKNKAPVLMLKEKGKCVKVGK